MADRVLCSRCGRGHWGSGLSKPPKARVSLYEENDIPMGKTTTTKLFGWCIDCRPKVMDALHAAGCINYTIGDETA